METKIITKTDLDAENFYAATEAVTKLPVTEWKQWKFLHLLVDETQDISHLFLKFYRALPIPNRFYTGDPDQAIFGFMGSNVECVHDIWRNDKAECISLEQNYRSGSEICEAAQRLIQYNGTSRYPKRTISATGTKGQVTYRLGLAGATDELHSTAKAIQKLGENNPKNGCCQKSETV